MSKHRYTHNEVSRELDSLWVKELERTNEKLNAIADAAVFALDMNNAASCGEAEFSEAVTAWARLQALLADRAGRIELD